MGDTLTVVSLTSLVQWLQWFLLGHHTAAAPPARLLARNGEIGTQGRQEEQCCLTHQGVPIETPRSYGPK